MATDLFSRASELVTGRMSDAAYAWGWAVVRGMPEGYAHWLFRSAADLAYARGGPAVDRLRTNLARVAPSRPLEPLTREALRSYARYWCEVFRLPVIPTARVVAGTATTGEEHFRRAVASGDGLVIALSHSGNWDAAAVWCIGTGVPFTTVAERLKPEQLFDRFVAFREGLGMEVLPLTGGARPPSEVLRERLESGGVLCLLADRDLTANGVDVTFFGATARMPAGPAALALRTGATLLPVLLSFTPRGWHIEFTEPVEHTDVQRMTQAIADAFERGITAHPQDWHMLQRLWLDDLADSDPRKARLTSRPDG